MDYEVGAAATSVRASEEAAKSKGPKPTIVGAGVFGMVTEAIRIKMADGTTLSLKEGEAVEVTARSGSKLTVKVWSGHGGKLGTLPAAKFKPQPRVVTKDNKAEPEDHVYKKFTGKLFLAKKNAKGVKETKPRMEDVDQGGIGDCFMMAALGAIAKVNPGVIQDMVKWDAKLKMYRVRFKKMVSGKFVDHFEWVDPYLPTTARGDKLVYAQSDHKFDPKKTALWPAIVEKAYAQWKGGYHKLDKGGDAGDVMRDVLGKTTSEPGIPSAAKLIKTFKKYLAGKKAVTLSTKNSISQSSKTGLLRGSGDGPWTGNLVDHEGKNAEVKPGSVSINAVGPGTATDSGAKKTDKKHALAGANVKKGEVKYAAGGVSLEYKSGKGPAAKVTPTCTYRFKGHLNQGLNIHGNHAYILKDVKGSKVHLHNPWGAAAHKHPKALTAAQIRTYFSSVDVSG